MEVSFERGTECSRESRHLPAEIYNQLRILLSHSGQGCLFIPMRGMQYLAVADEEEIIFVDGQGSRVIEFAWQRFAPQARSELSAPVPYECVLYSAPAAELLARAQSEFAKAVELLAEREAVPEGASTVTSLARK